MLNKPTQAKQRAVNFSALILALAALNGCGGGGGDSSSPPATNNTSPPVTTITSRVSVDASIPESVRQQVAEVVSSVATVDKIPNTIVVGDGEDIVLALNAQGKILMTGVASSDGTTAFNAASTAVGLVSFALDTPENLTEKQVNEKIRSVAGFAQLTNLVDVALKAGRIAADDASVLQQVLLVAQQVKKSTTVAAQGKTGELLATPKILPTDPSVSTDYPFTLVENEDWIGKVSFDTNKTVRNSIPLAWSVVAKNSKGEVLPNGDLVLQPAGMGSRSVDAIGNTFGGIFTFLGRLTSPSVTVPDDNGKSFELTVAQTPEILQYNKAHALVDTILTGLDLQAGAGDKCRLAYVKAVMGSKSMAGLLTADPDNIMSQLGQWQANTLSMTNVLSASADVLDKCGSQAAKDTIESQAKRISSKMAYLVPIYRELKAVKKTYDFATIAERFFLISHYQDEEPAVYTVCINKNGGVDNCAEEYKITHLETTLPVSSPMTAGAKFGVTVAATDKNGDPTLVPAELEFVINDPSLLSYDPKTQKFTALAAGRPTIGVRDKVTVAKSVAPVTVNIDAPRLNKTKITLKVGETVTLPLQNAQGQNIVLNGETNWGTNLQGEVEGGVVAIYPNGFTTPTSTGTQIRIKGLKVGKAFVQGVNLRYNHNSQSIADYQTEIVEVVVEGDYAIKFDRYGRGGDQDLICQTAYSSYGFSQFDQCTSPIHVRIYCEGSGCDGDRFFTATKKILITTRYYREFGTNADDYIPDRECPLEHQQDMIPQSFGEANYNPEELEIYNPASKYWRQGVNTGWRSISYLNPLFNNAVNPTMDNRIFKNFTSIIHASEGYTCVPIAAKLDLNFRIYDSWENIYKDYPYTVNLE